MAFHHRVLPNGLTVVAECDDHAHTAAVGFFVRTGSRDETPQRMGVSHFLEHMMFKGTARREADDVNREFDEIGADYNAFTSNENTVYYAHVLPEFLPHAVDLLGDILRPALRDADFDMEKQVIIEEIGMYDDRPTWRLYDALQEQHFGEHPMGHRVLGTVDTVRALTAAQMRDYFEHRYSSDNITVAAAGRVDFDALVADVARLTQSWQPTGAARVYEPPVLTTHDQSMIDPAVTRHYMALLTPGPSAQDDQRFAASVLADVIGDSEGSRLHWSLVHPGLCDEAELEFQPHDRTGSFFAYASCDPVAADEVERTLLHTLHHVADDLSEHEIERSKNKLATRMVVGGESPGGAMRRLGSEWTYLGRHVALEDELASLMAVALADVRALCQAYPFNPYTLVRLAPPADR